jgi:hypothetical protein
LATEAGPSTAWPVIEHYPPPALPLLSLPGLSATGAVQVLLYLSRRELERNLLVSNSLES